MTKIKTISNYLSGLLLVSALLVSYSAPLMAQASIDYPIVKLRSLDKTTARTMTFEAGVGSTLKFGSVYIKVRACRKAPEMETPESAAFLQVWEVDTDKETNEETSNWVFSGWMFASSPGLSSMDHPIYDVWVLDCLQKKVGGAGEKDDEAREGEGEVKGAAEPEQPKNSSSASEDTPP